MGCRRYTVNGIYIPEKRHYYYGNFGILRYRHPCAKKTAVYHLQHLDDAITHAARRNIPTETGVSEGSILFELFFMYGFDPVQDMVIDRMYLSFNMLKREFLEKDLGRYGRQYV